MPIFGDLSEFPVPEVLLFIGSRTGRLRLFDIPEFATMEIDLSRGEAHALHLGGGRFTERTEIVTELSVIVETGEGRFEFRPQQIVPEKNKVPLPINELVILLVLEVDKKLAKQRALEATEPYYALETRVPEICIDPNLNLFFHQSRKLLAHGVRAEDLAEHLGFDRDVARLNLGYLRQLGFIKLLDETEIDAMRNGQRLKEISQKNDEYQLAAEASDLIKRSGKLLKLTSQSL